MNGIAGARAPRGRGRGSRRHGSLSRLAGAARLVAAATALAILPACAAVYPEIGTRTSRVAAGIPLDPGPPGDVVWLKIVSARVPPLTRGGKSWGKGGPDAYAKLFLNQKEILRTPVQSGTLEPSWPGGPRGNFIVDESAKLRVELWDANPLNDHPIGVADLDHVSGGPDGRVHVTLEGGAELVFAYEPAHAVVGLGLWVELRTSSVFVTRFLRESPADRAGLDKGDEILRIGGRDVKAMSPDEVRSSLNAVPSAGLSLSLRKADGTTTEVVLHDGPIYGMYDEYGPID